MARWRHAVGIALLLAGLLVYALLVMVIGATYVPAHWLVQTGFYALGGLAWLWPARFLLHWMARDGM